MKTEIKFPVNPNETVTEHNARVNEIINPLIVNSLIATTTKKTTAKKTTAKQIDYTSITRGDKYYPFTETIKKQFNTQYPGFLDIIEKSGLVNGSKTYGIYFKHFITDNGKQREIIAFTNFIPTPEKIRALPPALKSGLTITDNAGLKKSLPQLREYLSKFTDIILTVTPLIRLTNRKTLHFNSGA